MMQKVGAKQIDGGAILYGDWRLLSAMAVIMATAAGWIIRYQIPYGLAWPLGAGRARFFCGPYSPTYDFFSKHNAQSRRLTYVGMEWTDWYAYARESEESGFLS